MRIVAIRDIVSPIRSTIANAYIDFSQMTASVVAVGHRPMVDGKPVIGYGFNSNGRYAQHGPAGERFIPRLLQTPSRDSPARRRRPARSGEMLGGHDGATRSRAGTATARSRSACSTWRCGMPWPRPRRVPLWKLLADRYNGGEADDERLGLRRRRLLLPRQGSRRAAGRDEALSRPRLFLREDEDRRRAARRGPRAHRGGAEDRRRGRAAGGRRQRPLRPARRRSPTARRSPATACAGTRSRSIRSTICAHAALATHYAPPLATGENLFSMQDARNLIRHGGLRPDRDILQFDPALSYGLVEYLRTLDMLKAHGWSPRRCVPHGGHQFALNIAVGLGLRRQRMLSAGLRALRRLRRRLPGRRRPRRMPDAPGIGFERKADLWAVMKTA